MSTESKGTNEQQASALADASFQSLLTSWKAVFESLKLKARYHSDLVAADFRLSLKAVAIAAISILVFVGVALVLWSTLLIALTYTLINLGWHWGFCAALVVLLNLIAMLFVKRVLSSAISAIPMRATLEALLSSDEA